MVLRFGKPFQWSILSYVYHNIAGKYGGVMRIFIAGAHMELRSKALLDYRDGVTSADLLDNARSRELSATTHYHLALKDLSALIEHISSEGGTADDDDVNALFTMWFLILHYGLCDSHNIGASHVHLEGIRSFMKPYLKSCQQRGELNTIPNTLILTVKRFMDNYLALRGGSITGGRLWLDLLSEDPDSPVSYDALFYSARSCLAKVWGAQYPVSELLDDMENYRPLHFLHLCQKPKLDLLHLTATSNLGHNDAEGRQKLWKQLTKLGDEFADVLALAEKVTNSGSRRVIWTAYHATLEYYALQVLFSCLDPSDQHPSWLDQVITSATNIGHKAIKEDPRQLYRLVWPLAVAMVRTRDMIHRDWLKEQLLRAQILLPSFGSLNPDWDSSNLLGQLILEANTTTKRGNWRPAAIMSEKGHHMAGPEPSKSEYTVEAGHSITIPGGRKLSLTGGERLSIERQRIMSLQHGDFIDPNSELAKRTLRKIDMCIIPLMAFCYMLQFIDKLALSGATLLGLIDDLNLKGSQYSWASAVFYFGYLGWSWPSSYLIVRFPIGKYLAVTVFLWGGVLMCHAACQNFIGLLLTRFFLGVGEAAVAPGFALITGMFYTRKEQPMRQGGWFIGNSLGNIFGGLIAYAIGQIPSNTLQSWRYLFLILGSVTSAYAIPLWFFLPDSPAKAVFLNEEEREVAVKRTLENKTGVLDSDTFVPRQVIDAFTDPQLWLLVLYTIGVNLANGGLTSFGSLLVAGFGFSNLKALLIQMPMGGTQLVFLIVTSCVASLVPRMRLVLMIFNTLVSLAGLLMVFLLKGRTERMAGLCLATVYGANMPLALSLTSSNIGGFSKRSVSNATMFVAYCVGNIIGPQFYYTREKPRYQSGLAASVSGLAIGAAFLALLLVYYVTENKRRDRRAPQTRRMSVEEVLEENLAGKTDRQLPDFSTYSEADHEHAVISTFDLFSIGIGPSSSHTVGPMRAGNIFVADLLDANLLHKVNKIRVAIFGSLALTGEGHMTPSALLLGLESADVETVDTAYVPKRFKEIKSGGKLFLGQALPDGKGKEIAFDYKRDFVWEWSRKLPLHSNGMCLSVFDVDGNMLATNNLYSVGGGFVVNGALSINQPADANAQDQDGSDRGHHPADLTENLYYKEIHRADAAGDRRAGAEIKGLNDASTMSLSAPEAESKSLVAASSPEGSGITPVDTDSANTKGSNHPRYPFRDAASLIHLCHKHNLTIAQLVYENEKSLGYSEEQIYEKVLRIWQVMDESILESVQAEPGSLLPGSLRLHRRAPTLYKRLTRGLYHAHTLGVKKLGSDQDPSGNSTKSLSTQSQTIALTRTETGLGLSKRRMPRVHGSFDHPITPPPRRRAAFADMDYLNAFAIAVNETNAAGGRVVTAPTNGAAGIIPAVLKYTLEFISDDPERDVITFLLTAAAIGMLYKRGATISAAEGGCMAEVGVACSMAAGAFAACMGASPETIEQAAEIGIEHNLGLTCDPIGGLVQAPCIERNALGAIKAISSANLALSSETGRQKVRLDDAIRAMRVTAKGMRNEFKETRFKKIDLYESAADLGFVGAGIQLAPNMTRILDRLGVWADIEKESVVLDETSIRQGDSDRELGRFDLKGIKDKYGYAHMVGHRSSLANGIYQGCRRESSITFHFSTTVQQIKSFGPKPVFTVAPRDGGLQAAYDVEADILLGADGIKSNTRVAMLRDLGAADAEVKDTGQAAYRILIDRAAMEADPELRALIDADCVTRWIGEKRHVIAYPISSKQIYNVVTAQPDDHFAAAPSATYTTKGSKPVMLSVFSDFCPKVQRLLDLVPDGEVCEWKLRVHSPLPTWIHGSVALVGDACHPTLPHLAQGAAQAIEDAAVLGVVLAHLRDTSAHSINKALRIYERLRKERAELLVELAAASGRLLHLGEGEAKKQRDEQFKAAAQNGRAGPVPDRWVDAEVQRMIYATDVMQVAEEQFPRLFYHNQDAYSYAGAFKTSQHPPWLYNLSKTWESLLEEPFHGVTTDGTIVPDLFKRQDEKLPIQDIVSAAQNVLDQLSPEQRSGVLFPLNAREWRAWSNPEFLLRPLGLRLEEVSEPVVASILSVIEKSFSAKGYQKALIAMRINHFLGELCQLPKILNQYSYNFLIFGTPDTSSPWGWSLYGHHLCLNTFFIGSQIVVSPTFTGAEPNLIDAGPWSGSEILRLEGDLGLQLMASLPIAAQKQAQIFTELRDPQMNLTGNLKTDRWNQDDQRHLCGAFRDNRVVPYEGLRVSSFTPTQRIILLKIIEEFVLYLPDTARQKRLELVEAHFDETYFCWIGSYGERDPFYYRIQSPVIVCEFDHHSGVFLTNDQPAKFHTHTIIRTPNGGDYGNALRDEQDRLV
ncbi:hypothetical protein DV735_g4535, partial [Chaetothyriales sp. CBS 134920]